MRKLDKRGATSSSSGIVGVVLGVLAIVAFIVALIYGIQFAKGFMDIPSLSGFDLGQYMSESEKIGDIVDNPALNFLSYIFGEIPNAVIDATSPVGSIIVTIAIFMILFLMFGDILDAFGTFSSRSVAWTIGIALTIIAANFKLVMIFGSVGFALVSGIGILAVLLGILVPFLSYGLLHILILGKLKAWTLNRKGEIKGAKSLNKFSRGIRAGKAVADAVEQQ
jgi:hypothetical protein